MMKYLLAALLCFLLCGCTQDSIPTETTPETSAMEITPPAASMYAPGHPLEIPDVLRVYPLSLPEVQGMRAFDGGVLLLSGYNSTTLTLLTGEELTVAASCTLDFQLSPDDPSLQIHGDTLSFYNSIRQETWILDSSLKTIRQIAAPEDLSGSPILSTDRSTLYYCTPTAIRAWDLESGIRRTVKELSYDGQQLVALHLEDSLLQCRITDGSKVQTLFLDAGTGLMQDQWEGNAVLVTAPGRYYAALPTGNYQNLVFGLLDGTPTALFPADLNAPCTFLPDVHSAVTAAAQEDASIRLACYALGSGSLRADLHLPKLQVPKSITSGSGALVYILTYDPDADCDTIYRWHVPDSSGDTVVYTHPYEPDDTSLAQCRSLAAGIASRYGIDILIGEDALAVQPWDYVFEAETQSQLLLRELELLDQRLSRYPQAVLSASASHFTSVKISLVRQISGSPASGSLNTATGIQFFDGTDAYVAISVGKYAQQALYHELFHVMETHLLNETSAFDDWDIFNPAGFAYSYGYSAQQSFQSYLEGENRAFIDAYSMSFPKEDRARVMEYAMLPGQEDLFAHEALQGKLQKLCVGIRQAYGLRKSPEEFPWEQYLEESLAFQE